MQIPFHKYQGAGNDFIVLDQRERIWINATETDRIARLCDRRFGIGADGLLLLEKEEGYDFRMVYFNADGRLSSMCGNGGRCIIAFARYLGLIGETARFLAVDGPHQARILPDSRVELQMGDVKVVERGDDYYYLDTGSPHYVRFVADAFAVDTVAEGRNIRYNERFALTGTNVNFVSIVPPHGVRISTYERGVEGETLACGTGITAAALAYYLHQGQTYLTVAEVPVEAKGGDLAVRFQPLPQGGFTDIWLIGPAERVFGGEVVL